MAPHRGTIFRRNRNGARTFRAGLGLLATVLGLLPARIAFAQSTGKPPPDAKALVTAPGAAPSAPVKAPSLDVTTAAVSAGGQISTGNSRLIAGTVTSDFTTRFSDNGFGASIVGNYGRGGPPGAPTETTAQNIQASVRYDRYLLDPLSVFLINTGRHDRFQNLDFRYNLDPGVKYLFVQEPATSFWGELGYDLQVDVRNRDGRRIKDAAGATIDGVYDDKTAVDHSTRLFTGFNHAFNDAVNLHLGIEYLQSVVHATHYRFNFESLLAAKLGAGLSLGASFNARYDHAPLAGVKQLDTQSTLTIIYSFSNAAPPAPPPPCEPPPPPPPPPPAPAPPAAAPAPTPPPAEPPPPSTAPAPAPAPAPAATPAPSPTPALAPAP